jgi:hypothetical protein
VIAWTAAIAAGVFAVGAAASFLAVDSPAFSAGSSPVTTCQTGGPPAVGFDYRTLGDELVVTGVTVGGGPQAGTSISPACGDARMLLTLVGADGRVLGDVSATIPAGGGEVHVELPDPPVAADVRAIHVALLGPAQVGASG